MKPVDDAYFRDSGYGEILKRTDGDLYYPWLPRNR